MGRVCDNQPSWEVCAMWSSQPAEKDETSRKCWQFKHDYIFSTHDLARNVMWLLTAWMIWLHGKYHALTILWKICRVIEQASPLCFIYNSFSTSCDGISLTATAFFKDISSELSVEKRSLSFAMTRADKCWSVKRALRSSFNVWCGVGLARAFFACFRCALRPVKFSFLQSGNPIFFL